MAEEHDTWETAIQKALDANEGTSRPTSLRQLHERLAGLRGSNQKAESWKKTLRTIRASGRASEGHANLIARALGVPRSSLPPSADRLTLHLLESRLESLEEQALRTEDLGPILNVLQLLATGNRAAALRALSEVVGD